MHEITTHEIAGGLGVAIRPQLGVSWLVGGSIYVGLYALALVGMSAAFSAGGLWVSLGALIGLFVALLGAGVPWAAFVIAWYATGSEEIVVAHGVATVRLRFLGMTRTRHFALAEVRNLRVEPRVGMNRRLVLAYAYDRGAVAFDYGARTVRVGRRLSTWEAERVIQALGPALALFDGRRPARDDIEPMPEARFRIQERAEGIRVVMPFGNSPETLSVLALILLGLIPMVLIMPVSLSASLAEVGASSPYIFAGVGLVTLVVLLLVVALTLTPREIAEVGGGQLVLKVTPSGVAWIPARRFDVRFLHNMRRVAPEPPHDMTGMWADYFKQQTGQVAFGFGPEQHRFGTQIDAPEARAICELVEQALAVQPGYQTLAADAYARGISAAEEAAAEEEEAEPPANPLPEPPSLPPQAQ